MKGDVVLGMLLGGLAGVTVATFCKPAQNMVKKGTEKLKQGTATLCEKLNENSTSEENMEEE